MGARIRIISGSARGRWIYSLKGRQTRPMLGRVKDSLFNIIRPRLSGAYILDLFAGTGALGLEALSRGAKFCLFIEKDRQSFHLIKKNVERLGFATQSKVVLLDAFKIVRFLLKPEFHPDIVFICPPYKFFDQTAPERIKLLEIMDEMVKQNVLVENGLIIAEHLRKQFDDIPVKHLSLSDQRDYGQTTLSFLVPLV